MEKYTWQPVEYGEGAKKAPEKTLLLLNIRVEGAQQLYWFAVGSAKHDNHITTFSSYVPGIIDCIIPNVTHWMLLPNFPLEQIVTPDDAF